MVLPNSTSRLGQKSKTELGGWLTRTKTAAATLSIPNTWANPAVAPAMFAKPPFLH